MTKINLTASLRLHTRAKYGEKWFRAFLSFILPMLKNLKQKVRTMKINFTYYSTFRLHRFG